MTELQNLTGFACSVAREVTSECETYTNYATATVARMLEQNQGDREQLSKLVEQAIAQTKTEENLTIAYVYSDLVHSRFRQLYVSNGLNHFLSTAVSGWLGLVNWTQISVRLISDYETENDVELLDALERSRF